MRSILAGFSVIVLSCSTQTTNGDGGVTGSDGGRPYDLSSLDAPCEGSLSGRQLMNFIHSPYTGTYTPPSSRPADKQWTGSKTPSALTVSLSYGNGAIVCTPTPPYDCCSGCPCAAPAPPFLTVELDLAFKTADGTLDEKLVVKARLEKNFPTVSFTGEQLATKIGGTYPITAGTAQETKLSFNGSFEGAKCNGGISEMTSKISFSGGAWVSQESTSDGGADAAGD